MGTTAAIAATEILDRRHSAHVRKPSGTFVLEASTIVRIPDTDGSDEIAQVVDMPVLALLFSEMPFDAGPHATRPECTSNVDVIPDFEINRAPSAYPGRSF